MKNPGKDFEARIRHRFEQAGCYVEKRSDAAAPFIGRPDLGGDEDLSRFAPKSPYDLLVLQPVGVGLFRAFAFECKSTAGTRFDLATVKPHQIAGLDRFPGLAGVLVEVRAARRCFFVALKLLKSWTETRGKKSMNIDDLAAFANEMKIDSHGREKLDYYSVEKFLKT